LALIRDLKPRHMLEDTWRFGAASPRLVVRRGILVIFVIDDLFGSETPRARGNITSTIG
jgi:hypothetical protein